MVQIDTVLWCRYVCTALAFTPKTAIVTFFFTFAARCLAAFYNHSPSESKPPYLLLGDHYPSQWLLLVSIHFPQVVGKQHCLMLTQHERFQCLLSASSDGIISSSYLILTHIFSLFSLYQGKPGTVMGFCILTIFKERVEQSCWCGKRWQEDCFVLSKVSTSYQPTEG